MHYLIGIDIGTSGTKAVAYTAGGAVLATAYEGYAVITGPDGMHEMEPAVLMQAVIRTIRDCKQQADPGNQLMGICFSSAMHSVAAMDREGRALTHFITWADLRSRKNASALRASDAGHRIYQRTTIPVHAMTPLCKIAWLREAKPDLFAATAKFIGIKEWLWFQFFGTYEVDYSIASGTGLFDIYKLDWNPESLDYAGISPAQLSQPVAPTHSASRLRREYAEAMGIPAGIPFFIGAGDGCLANLGTGAIGSGDLAITIGTSGAARMVTGAPVQDSEERLFNFYLSPQHYVSGGAINNGMIAVKWFTERIMKEGSSIDLFETIDTIQKLAPGADGLIFLPYLMGERAPVWDASAKALFFGIQESHGQTHFLRAVIEGVCYSLCQISNILQEVVGPAQQVYVSGGFIRSTPWLQALSDILGRETIVTHQQDASSLGAAILGLYALREIDNLEYAKKMMHTQSLYTPDEERHNLYRKNFEVYETLYDRLKDLFHRTITG